MFSRVRISLPCAALVLGAACTPLRDPATPTSKSNGDASTCKCRQAEDSEGTQTTPTALDGTQPSASSLSNDGDSPAPLSGAFLTAAGPERVEWTRHDLLQEIAIRTLNVTESASYHVVRLRGDEKPHIHEKSDLTVTVLSGKVRMNLGAQVVTIEPGQVIDIPRGTFHFAENLSNDASEAYVVFSPPLEKGDNVPASLPASGEGPSNGEVPTARNLPTAHPGRIAQVPAGAQ